MVTKGSLKRDNGHLPTGGESVQFKRFRDEGHTDTDNTHCTLPLYPHDSLFSYDSLSYGQKVVDGLGACIPPYLYPHDASFVESVESEDRKSSKSPRSSSTAHSSDIAPPSRTDFASVGPTQPKPQATPQAKYNKRERSSTDEGPMIMNSSGAASDASTFLKLQEQRNHANISQPSRHSTRVTAASGRVEIGNLKALEDYFYSRCAAMLVNPCKPVAAKVIDLLCPEKKQEHPYLNPKKPELFQGQPEWWPSGINYESPHHMRKKDLLSFLCYLLTLPHTHLSHIQAAVEKGKFSSWQSLLESTLTDLDLHDNREETDKDRKEFDDKRHHARLRVVKEMYRISGCAAKCAEGHYNKDDKVDYDAVPEICFRDSKKKSKSSQDSVLPQEPLLVEPALAEIKAIEEEGAATKLMENQELVETKSSLGISQQHPHPNSIHIVPGQNLEWSSLGIEFIGPPVNLGPSFHDHSFESSISGSPRTAHQVEAGEDALQGPSSDWTWDGFEGDQMHPTQLMDTFNFHPNQDWCHPFVGSVGGNHDAHNRVMASREHVPYEPVGISRRYTYPPEQPMPTTPHPATLYGDCYPQLVSDSMYPPSVPLCTCGNQRRLMPQECPTYPGSGLYSNCASQPKMIRRRSSLRQVSNS